MKWIAVKKEKSILKVKMNRPEVRNAFNPEMISEITQVFKTIPAEVRVILFDGEGKSFSAGADLEWMRSMVNFSLDENKQDAMALYDMFSAIRQCPQPVVTRVHGAAMGGGLGLLAASDIVIADRQTQFCFSEVKLGIAPAVISRFVLEKSNLGSVAPWMISGRVFGVEEAQRMNLIHGVYDTEDEAEALVDSWLQGFLLAAPGAVSATKKLLIEINQFADQNKSEEHKRKMTTQLIAERRISEEGQEGLKSFLTKTKPSWSED